MLTAGLWQDKDFTVSHQDLLSRLNVKSKSNSREKWKQEDLWSDFLLLLLEIAIKKYFSFISS